MDYRKLCVELFGTDDEATLRKIAAEYRNCLLYTSDAADEL